MNSLTRIALFAISLLVLAFQAQATPGYLEWQPSHLSDGQSSLKTRFSAKPQYPESSQTEKKLIQLIALPYQHFAVCADQVKSNTTNGAPAFISLQEESGKHDHYYQLVTSEPATTLELLRPSGCAVDGDSYPYHFLDFLHSEQPFLAVELEGKAKGHRRQEDTGGGIPLALQSSPGTLKNNRHPDIIRAYFFAEELVRPTASE